MAKKALLSVVEELKGIKLEDFGADLYDPQFWYPYVPLKNKTIEQLDEKTYSYDVSDTIYMDVTKTMKFDFDSNGTIQVVKDSDEGSKGRLWVLKVDVKKPEAQIEVNIRARNVANGIKIGFFVYKLSYDLGKLDALGFGTDAVHFAGRVKLRDLLKNFEKNFSK